MRGIKILVGNRNKWIGKFSPTLKEEKDKRRKKLVYVTGGQSASSNNFNKKHFQCPSIFFKAFFLMLREVAMVRFPVREIFLGSPCDKFPRETFE